MDEYPADVTGDVDDATDVAIADDAIDAAAADDAIDVAVAESTPGKRRLVELEWHLTVKGGVSTKPKVVPTISVVACGDAKFARLNKYEPWFVQSIVSSGKRHEARRVKIIDMLKAKLNDATTSDVADDSQTGAPASSEPADIMDALDTIDDEPTPKKKKYAGKRKRNTSTTLPMTPQPLCVDPNSPRKDVTVLARSTTSLWISVDDIPWLLNYALDEIESGGVPAVVDGEPDDPDDESNVGDPVADSNCGVPGLCIKWDYKNETESYTAVITSGPCANTVVTTGMANFTAEKWARINPPRTGSFADATYPEKRDALFAFLKQHMLTMMASDTKCVGQ